LYDNSWKVQHVSGIREKLQAAVDAGCRRVFLPQDNSADVPMEIGEQLDIIPVSEITDVLLHLEAPLQPSDYGSLQGMKVRALYDSCFEAGWQLSGGTPVQHGVQFTVSPPTDNGLKLTIYDSGKHSPRTHPDLRFEGVLAKLQELEEASRPVGVNEVLVIKDRDLREEIQAILRKSVSTDLGERPHSEYAYRFERGHERFTITQYATGKLVLQGRGGSWCRGIWGDVKARYNLHYPQAGLTTELVTTHPPLSDSKRSADDPQTVDLPLPYIGIDESGKGDYFGPLVVAAVWVDSKLEEELKRLGVRDSKRLSDQRCAEMAAKIASVGKGLFKIVAISPRAYNSLYRDIKGENKNLNHLLAWGHARALEDLLAKRDSQCAVSDQFGDEKYLKSKLMARGKDVDLIQVPRAEEYTAVAAASILARYEFLRRLNDLGNSHGVSLPKGASKEVIRVARGLVRKKGPEVLQEISKVHFKTTRHVLDGLD